MWLNHLLGEAISRRLHNGGSSVQMELQEAGSAAEGATCDNQEPCTCDRHPGTPCRHVGPQALDKTDVCNRRRNRRNRRTPAPVASPDKQPPQPRCRRSPPRNLVLGDGRVIPARAGCSAHTPRTLKLSNGRVKEYLRPRSQTIAALGPGDSRLARCELTLFRASGN